MGPTTAASVQLFRGVLLQICAKQNQISITSAPIELVCHMNITELPEFSFNHSINRSYSQETLFNLKSNHTVSRCEVFTKYMRYTDPMKDTILCTRYNIRCSSVPFSGEKRLKLFRRALLEVIEGWRLLAPTARTRSMSGFCAAVDTAACATRISNLDISGFTLRILPMSAVLCGCSVLPIDIRCQVSGVR